MDVHVLYMRKTAFLRLVKVKLGPKFCFALGSRLKAHRFPPGLCPSTLWGTSVPYRPSETWTPSHKNPATPLPSPRGLMRSVPFVYSDSHSVCELQK